MIKRILYFISLLTFLNASDTLFERFSKQELNLENLTSQAVTFDLFADQRHVLAPLEQKRIESTATFQFFSGATLFSQMMLKNYRTNHTDQNIAQKANITLQPGEKRQFILRAQNYFTGLETTTDFKWQTTRCAINLVFGAQEELPEVLKPLRIVIDLQGAQGESKDRGLGKWSLNFAKAFARNARQYDLHLALNASFPDTIDPLRREFNRLIPRENIHLWTPQPNCSYISCFAQGDFGPREKSKKQYEDFIESLNPDTLLICSLFEGLGADIVFSFKENHKYRVLTILYDLIPMVFPEIYLQDPRINLWYPEQLELLKQSDHLLTISDYTKLEALKLLPFSEGQVTSISSAIPDEFLSKTMANPSLLLPKFSIKKDFLLCVMSTDFRKNVEGLIESFCMSGKEITDHHQLVIVTRLFGSQEAFLKEQIRKYGLDDNTIIVTNFVSDEELITLYKTSKAVIYPSHYEGFGLSVLEGMTFGKAVICSNNSSIPEVIEYPEALFDSKNNLKISQKIREVLLNDVFRNTLEIHGLKQSQKFSWDITARKAAESLKNRIFVDISELYQSDAKTGIQRVVRSIVDELSRTSLQKSQMIRTVHAGKEPFYRYTNELQVTKFQEEKVIFSKGDTLLGLDLNALMIPQMLKYYQHLSQIGVNLVFCVYDLLPIRMSWFFPGAVNWFVPWLSTITKVSNQIICISKAVADDLKLWLQENPQPRTTPLKIDYFHLGCDLENSVPTRGIPDDAERVLLRMKQSINFLMVGTVEPRKGHKQTLQAFTKLWQEGSNPNLFIVGKQGWMMDDFVQNAMNHPQKNQNLFWLAGISDEYLEIIYKNSTCLIASSEGEGFGLPLIEGAMHGLPIIARDIPVFREVTNNAAYFFSGLEPEAISSAVREWMVLFEQKRHPTSGGVRALTWKESTEQLLKVMEVD